MLIIIDKSSKVELDRNLLNTNLEFFLEETDEPKFIVITEDKEDIMIQDMLQFEINELDAYSAARLLLLLVAHQHIEDHNKDVSTLSEHEIFKLISRNPFSIVRFARFINSSSKKLDEIVHEQKTLIADFGVSSITKEQNVLGVINDDWSWVIKQSYETLIKSYSDQLEILFLLCQLPGGAVDSDFKDMFEEKHPKWKEFIEILMKYKQRMLDDAKERINGLELDEETFWLVTSKEIPQLSQSHYIPYQIVYIYVNKVIITPEQRQVA